MFYPTVVTLVRNTPIKCHGGSSSFKVSNRCSSLYVKKCDAWEIPKLQKQLLGKRSLIVTGDDDYSKHLSQRMWFEMQKNNIEGVFCTMNTQYPIERNIKESIELFRRTGAESIISIGAGNVSDFTKLMRDLIEIGFKKSDDILNYKSLKLVVFYNLIQLFQSLVCNIYYYL
jgi:alcohol dehydrogenase class IV